MRRSFVPILLLASCTQAPVEITTDPGVALDPAGPYIDGAEVTVTVPHGTSADWFNFAIRFCTDQWCDPTWTPPSYDAITSSEAGDTARVVVPAVIFTPDGWRRCDDEVTCRLVVPGADGTRHESEPLRFEGELRERPTLVVDGTTVHPHGVEPHPSAIDEELPITASVCAYLAAGSDCDLLGDEVIDVAGDAPFRLSGRREIRGAQAWHDCAATPCFVQVRRLIIVGRDGPATLGYDEIVAAAPLRFDPTVPAAPRPTLRVLEPGPFVRGDAVTVVVEHLPPGTDALLATCDGARPYANCRFPSLEDAVDGTHAFTVWECCEIALMPGQEGATAIASVSVDVRSAP